MAPGFVGGFASSQPLRGSTENDAQRLFASANGSGDNGKSRERNQNCFRPRNIDTRPIMFRYENHGTLPGRALAIRCNQKVSFLRMTRVNTDPA